MDRVAGQVRRQEVWGPEINDGMQRQAVPRRLFRLVVGRLGRMQQGLRHGIAEAQP